MNSQPDRLDKIKALLASPVEGERAAARAALDRLEMRPERGTAEWFEAVREFHRKIDFCVSRLGVSDLKPAEIKTVRNLYRYRGDPWSRGASEFVSVYRKILSASQAEPVHLLGSAAAETISKEAF
ncbi:MAG: hypothetical protein WBA48_00695 [Xanthobacteraceae bacterium]